MNTVLISTLWLHTQQYPSFFGITRMIGSSQFKTKLTFKLKQQELPCLQRDRAQIFQLMKYVH